jgi:hypothetical protein
MKWLLAFRRWRERDRALEEEFNAHVEDLTDELVSSGYSPEEARYKARRLFGNRTALLEESHDIWRLKWLDALLRDLRFSWRLARRQPWTVAAVIASIAIGVGANAAITSVLDTVLLNPLGIENSGQMIAATVHVKKLHMTDAESSAAEFRDLQSMTDVFSAVTATEQRAWTLQAGQPSRLIGLAVTPGFFKIFEPRPSMGRYFDGSDTTEIFLSYGL